MCNLEEHTYLTMQVSPPFASFQTHRGAASHTQYLQQIVALLAFILVEKRLRSPWNILSSCWVNTPFTEVKSWRPLPSLPHASRNWRLSSHPTPCFDGKPTQGCYEMERSVEFYRLSPISNVNVYFLLGDSSLMPFKIPSEEWHY